MTHAEYMQEVEDELVAMIHGGMRVPIESFWIIRNKKFIEENCNLKISQAADLAITMADPNGKVAAPRFYI